MIDAVVLNDTRVDRHHGCSFVMAAIYEGLARAGVRVLASSPAHSEWTRDTLFMAALKRSQLVVVNGEGTLHHDRPAGLCLLQVAEVARERGIASALINAGWQANGSAYLNLVRCFDLVSTRDRRSAAELADAGIVCRVVPDLSLVASAPLPQERVGIGFTDSVDRTVSLQLEVARRACGAAAVAIQYSLPGLAQNFHFYRESIAAEDVRNPVRMLSRLRSRHTHRRSAHPSRDRFLARVASLELLVSGRFHACTLALVAGTPFICAGTNSHKITALLEDAGLESWRAAIPLDRAGILAARDRGLTETERANVAAYLREARAGAATLFADLPSLVR